MHPGAAHGVPEAERLPLAKEMYFGKRARGMHPFELREVALPFEGRLQLGHPVEVVREVVLVAARHDEHIAQAGIRRLLDHILDRRLVDDGQHFLRHRLRRRQEAGAEPRRGNHCFRHRRLLDRGRTLHSIRLACP